MGPKITVRIAALLLCALVLTACGAQNAQTAAGGASAASSAAASAAPAASSAASGQQAAMVSPSGDKPKNATWIIDINDTQQITDETGIVWNYTLTFHASKPGGKNVAGEFTGEAVLKIEPDFASAQAAAAKEGTQLLDMLFNYHAECESLTFVVEKFSQEEYSAQMKEHSKDIPLQPFDPNPTTDFFAIVGAAFEGTQEPISMTLMHDGKPQSGTAGGGGASVTVATEISIEGATAYVFFFSTPHPLERAFKGIVTGDVLPE